MRAPISHKFSTSTAAALPSGEVERAVAVPLLHVENDLTPSIDRTKDVVRFRSDTTIKHDADTGDLDIKCVDDITITAAGNIRMTGQRIDLN